MMHTAILAALLLAQVENAQEPPPRTPMPYEHLVDWFEPHELHFSGGRYQEETFYYRLFVPRTLEVDMKYPLVVWVHGHGAEELENINRGQLTHTQLVFTEPDDQQNCDFFFVAFQCPGDRGWFDRFGQPTGDEPITILMLALEEVLDSHPIDTERVSLVGVSSGGSACWELALRHPNTFSAIAPLAAGSSDASQAALLVNESIWAFHSTDDDSTADHDRAMVQAIREAGGTCFYTEIDWDSHDCWTPAIRDYWLMDWLLAQRRGTAATIPERYVPWVPVSSTTEEFTPLIVPLTVGLVVLSVVAVTLELRRRKRISEKR